MWEEAGGTTREEERVTAIFRILSASFQCDPCLRKEGMRKGVNIRRKERRKQGRKEEHLRIEGKGV